MLSLGAFAFAAPGMLALLLVLPVIYWLLRMIPPLPKLVRFPAIRLLIGLEPTEQTPMKMPWWLLLLRLLLATALILAVARPLLNPQADLPGRGPLMLVIDDGWSSAPGWTTRIAHAERLIQRAERAQRPVVLTGTAPLPLESSVPGVFCVGDVRAGSVKRVGGAIGEGAAVVAQVHAYLAAASAAGPVRAPRAAQPPPAHA